MYGYISRITCPDKKQLIFFRPQWRLALPVHEYFRKMVGGFINLEIISIPPSFEEGYPNEARDHIKMTILRDHEPHQVRLINR